jgi:hypothetical protein
MGDNYKRHIASITVDYLEKDFKMRVLNRLDYDSNNIKLDSYVQKVAYYVSEIYKEQPKDSQIQFNNNTLYDDSTGIFPSALAFFLFQAGLHSEAIDFLNKYPNRGSQLNGQMTNFGKLYARYVNDYGKSIP